MPKTHRGRGIARSLMDEVLADADQEGTTLCLNINAYGDMSWEELEAWYLRLGFSWLPGEPLMVRLCAENPTGPACTAVTLSTETRKQRPEASPFARLR